MAQESHTTKVVRLSGLNWARTTRASRYCKIDGILTVVDAVHFLDQLSRERPEGTAGLPSRLQGLAGSVGIKQSTAATNSFWDHLYNINKGKNTNDTI